MLSPIEPRVLRLFGRRAEARLARAGELATLARRDASVASDALDAARAELARIELNIAHSRQALGSRPARGDACTALMRRNDFARFEHAHAQLAAHRLNARAIMDATKKRLDAALATLEECENTLRTCWRQREKYGLAERLSAGVGIDEAVHTSPRLASTRSSIQPMRVPR